MDGSMFIGTWWALIPPLLAIILAFVTKEVYSSLFLGVAVGAMLGGIPAIDRLEEDPFENIETGDYVKVHATEGYIEVFKKGES